MPAATTIVVARDDFSIPGGESRDGSEERDPAALESRFFRNDPQRLDRVILTPRPDRVFSPPAPAMAQMTPPPDNTPQMDPQPAYVPPPPQAQPVNRGAPGAQGEGKPDDTDSDQ